MTTISEIMTPNPMVLGLDATAAEAARTMRDNNIGDVLVMDGKDLRGIVTDRDLVTRVMAGGADPDSVTLADCCSSSLVTANADDAVEDVVNLMRQKAIRRVPVLRDNEPVGIVSLGDLAIEKDRASALADISAAPPDH